MEKKTEEILKERYWGSGKNSSVAEKKQVPLEEDSSEDSDEQ